MAVPYGQIEKESWLRDHYVGLFILVAVIIGIIACGQTLYTRLQPPKPVMTPVMAVAPEPPAGPPPKVDLPGMARPDAPVKHKKKLPPAPPPHHR